MNVLCGHIIDNSKQYLQLIQISCHPQLINSFLLYVLGNVLLYNFENSSKYRQNEYLKSLTDRWLSNQMSVISVLLFWKKNKTSSSQCSDPWPLTWFLFCFHALWGWRGFLTGAGQRGRRGFNKWPPSNSCPKSQAKAGSQRSGLGPLCPDSVT